MLETGGEEERLQALKTLVSLPPETRLPLLCKALGDQSWRVRKEAVSVFLALPRAVGSVEGVIQLLYSEENAGLRNAAVEILVCLGAPAVPPLLDELSRADHEVRKFILDILGEIGDPASVRPILKSLNDTDGNVRQAAAENLGKIGAAAAVAALLDAMARPDLWFRFAILDALGRIGESVPAQKLLIFSEERLLRKALFDCLAKVGDGEAVPVLLAGLGDDMRNIREAAAVALERIGRRAPLEVKEGLRTLCGHSAIDELGLLLASTDKNVRQATITLLGWAGDRRFASPLLELFAEEGLEERVVEALVAMGGEGDEDLASLWPLAKGRSKVCLAFVLGETGRDTSLGALLDGLAGKDPELRLVSAQGLGKLGDASCIVELAASLKDPSREVRESAEEALVLVGRRFPEGAVRVLLPLLEAEDPEMRMQAVSVLGRLEGAVGEEPLGLALKDDSPLVRRAAVAALERQAGEGQMEALILALTDEDTEVRRLAAEALGGARDLQALHPLELALRDEDIWVRAAAVRALGRIGGPRAISAVETALEDPVGLVGIAALETLTGVDSGRAYPILTRALGHEDGEVVNAALQLLVAGGRTDWIPPVLDTLIHHRQWQVRTEFIRALAELQGSASLPHLENRLPLEDEPLVLDQIRDLLSLFGDSQG